MSRQILSSVGKRERFRKFWDRLSNRQPRRRGRPRTAAELRRLIEHMPEGFYSRPGDIHSAEADSPFRSRTLADATCVFFIETHRHTLLVFSTFEFLDRTGVQQKKAGFSLCSRG